MDALLEKLGIGQVNAGAATGAADHRIACMVPNSYRPRPSTDNPSRG